MPDCNFLSEVLRHRAQGTRDPEPEQPDKLRIFQAAVELLLLASHSEKSSWHHGLGLKLFGL